MAERFKVSDAGSASPGSSHDEDPAGAASSGGSSYAPVAAGGGRALPVTAAGAVPVGGDQRLDREVQRAQEQLLNLKRQQEQIEKQKRELEELSRRQEEVEDGKREMSEKLTRALVILDRQSTEAQKRVEQLRGTMDAFTNHLRALDSIQPKSWHGSDLQKELSRALSMVDHARTEFNQARARLLPDPAAPSSENAAETAAATASEYEEVFRDSADRSFLYWLRAGLAFTLPLLILGLIALVVYCCLTLSLRSGVS